MLDATVGDDVDRLALVVQQQQQQPASTARRTATTATASSASSSHPPISSMSAAAMRHELMGRAGVADPARFADLLDSFWEYQTCTEFGFYQTCDVGSACMWVQGLDTLANEIAFCPTAYNVSAAQVAANVAYSNEYYGGRSPAATCVLYVSGEVDPWQANSILTPPSPSSQLQTLWVPGASHHAWTHPSAPTDQASVIAARAVIADFVNGSLNRPCLQAVAA